MQNLAYTTLTITWNKDLENSLITALYENTLYATLAVETFMTMT